MLLYSTSQIVLVVLGEMLLCHYVIMSLCYYVIMLLCHILCHVFCYTIILLGQVLHRFYVRCSRYCFHLPKEGWFIRSDTPIWYLQIYTRGIVMSVWIVIFVSLFSCFCRGAAVVAQNFLELLVLMCAILYMCIHLHLLWRGTRRPFRMESITQSVRMSVDLGSSLELESHALCRRNLCRLSSPKNYNLMWSVDIKTSNIRQQSYHFNPF